MPKIDRAALLKKLLAEVRLVSKPIDFAKLEAQGVLSKAGIWYRLHDFAKLPKNARAQMTSLTQDARGVMVKFRTMSEKRAVKLLKIK